MKDGSAVDLIWGPNDLHTFCHSRAVRGRTRDEQNKWSDSAKEKNYMLDPEETMKEINDTMTTKYCFAAQQQVCPVKVLLTVYIVQLGQVRFSPFLYA